MTEKIINPADLKKDDLLCFHEWVKVEGLIKRDGTQVKVRNLDSGQEYQILGKELVEVALSGDQFTKTEKVSQTRAAEILLASKNMPFTVRFEKQDGTERTLRGRLVSAEPLLGRSRVEDLDLPQGKDRMRLVDHRTLISITVGGVCYEVKK